MRLFALELKRLLKSRRSLLVVCFMLAFTIFMAWVPTSFIMSHDTAGNPLTGLDALAYDKNLEQGIAGTVTPEKVQQALITYQDVFARYNAETTFDLPDEAYDEINAVQGLLFDLGDLYPDKNGQTLPWLEIDPDEVTSYYETIPLRVAAISQAQYPAVSGVGDYFTELYAQVDTPFNYVPGADATTLDYLILLSFVLLLCCALITAPVFASDYQIGADDIQRCTKNGRARLGWTRVFASLLICGVLTSVCLALYWCISNSLYGWEVTDASAQMLALFGPLTPLPFDFGGLQILFSVLALLTILATVCAVLLLSSRLKNLVAATGCALLLCFLPVLVYMTLPAIVVDWVNTFLPSTGIALQACTLYATRYYNILHLDDLICWTPIATSIAGAVELVLFAALAVVSYVRRHA